LDITLQRVGSDPLIVGAYPYALRTGQNRVQVTLYGANLPATAQGSDIDFGPGVSVTRVVRATPDAVTVELNVNAQAPRGARDVFLAGASGPQSVVVYEEVDRIEVAPAAGIARVGGAAFPKQFQQFEAIGYDDGPNDDDDADDLRLGVMPAAWTLEEYAVTYDDDDLRFVGAIDADGLFTPALDGPNPERSRNRNNVGDVWVVATHTRPDGTKLRARGHLLVTVPLYMRWDPWGQSQ
jgi:quinohemoprotein amine dehydrogenase